MTESAISRYEHTPLLMTILSLYEISMGDFLMCEHTLSAQVYCISMKVVMDTLSFNTMSTLWIPNYVSKWDMTESAVSRYEHTSLLMARVSFYKISVGNVA